MPMNIGLSRAGRSAARSIPVFPLPGALLLPRGQMPLNIFEPRYLAMIDDAMARRSSPDRHDPARHRASRPRRQADISTRSAASAASRSSPRPATGATCCELTGIARFRVEEELTVLDPLSPVPRRATSRSPTTSRRARARTRSTAKSCCTALTTSSKANKLKADWDGIEKRAERGAGQRAGDDVALRRRPRSRRCWRRRTSRPAPKSWSPSPRSNSPRT